MNAENQNDLPFSVERSFDDVVADLRRGSTQPAPKKKKPFKWVIGGIFLGCGVLIGVIGFARMTPKRETAIQTTSPDAGEFIAPSPSPTTTAACAALTYRDEFSNTAGSYTLLQQQASFNSGDVVVFVNKMTNTSSQLLSVALTSDFRKNTESLQFLDSTCGTAAFHAGVLNCPPQTLLPNQSTAIIFRAKTTPKTTGKNVLQTSLVSFADRSTSCTATFSVNSPTPSPH